jgi:hypothetical protein
VLSTIMQADGRRCGVSQVSCVPFQLLPVILFSYNHVVSSARSALLVLDARTWREVARAVLPYALPNGFHGCWTP